MFLLFLIIGALSGTLSGLLGIGGGIIVVPALAASFVYFGIIPSDYIMQMAIGTSLAAMIMTSLSALTAHHKRRTVRWDLVKQLLPGLVIGSILGATIAHDLPSKYLRIFFGIFLFIMSLRLLFLKMEPGTAPLPSSYKMMGVAGLIGLLSSILGAGGGTMMIPFMLRYQVSIREAAGTSVACGIGIGVVATISFMLLGVSVVGLPWSSGYIYWPAFIGVSLASVLFAPIGTAIAHRLPASILKRVLGIFLLLISFDMLFVG